mgnify:CR=1 FL=1
MKHLGNISKINVAEAEAVDVVIGGSPCQDLSIAGKRAGLDGARSGLFMEEIRICKEMRERDRAAGRAGIDVRPRFCVWENVPGAFSSNDGEDFRIVLEEFCKVADPDAAVPRPPKGKWKSAGCIVGDGYSVAWRIMDARYYGVPQRRRRISLVADFAGGCAPQILFDEQGMCWNLETSQKAWQEITGHAAGSVGGSGGIGVILNNQAVLYALDSMSSNSMKSSNPHSGFHEETVAKTLQAGGVDPTCNQGGNVIVEPVYALQGNGIDRAETAGCNGKGWCEDVCYTLNTIDRPGICFKAEQGAKEQPPAVPETVTPTMESEPGGNTVPGLVYDARGNGDGKTVCTITGDHCDRITDYTPLVLATAQGGAEVGKNESPCLMAGHERPIVSAIDCINMKQVGDVSGTLCAKKAGYSLNYQNPVVYTAKTRRKYIVRRLTPMECSRLQGLPDDFADVPAYEDVSDGELDFWREVWAEWAEINGKNPKTDKQIRKWLQVPISESNQYQIYGNGIALPQWVWVLGRISENLGKDNPTMASLFDGSGSFPLIWEAINGKGTAVWSSEVNPEAIRVSRYHIGGDAPC